MSSKNKMDVAKAASLAGGDNPADKDPRLGKRRGSMTDTEAKHGKKPVDMGAVERKAAKTRMTDEFMAGLGVEDLSPAAEKAVEPPAAPPPPTKGSKK